MMVPGQGIPPLSFGGNIVGGASNFMSAYFHRLKPNDFKLLSTYGAIEGANVVDWPIGYQDLEPYYAKVESLVGVSGKLVEHPHLEPRSTPDFPFPPTAEHPVAARFDKACNSLGFHPLPMAREYCRCPITVVIAVSILVTVAAMVVTLGLRQALGLLYSIKWFKKRTLPC